MAALPAGGGVGWREDVPAVHWEGGVRHTRRAVGGESLGPRVASGWASVARSARIEWRGVRRVFSERPVEARSAVDGSSFRAGVHGTPRCARAVDAQIGCEVKGRR